VPGLVLLHGFTHTGASWRGVIDHLPERYTPLAPDVRGHGSASERLPVTLEAVIGDIDTAAPETFALAGYSMGGRIALHVALAFPRRVERLVLISASPGIAEPVERAARRRADEHLAGEIESGSIEEFAHRWAQTPVLAGLPPEIEVEVHADRLRSTPAGLARALRGLGTGALPPLWDRLGELTMPVTVIAGERDAKFSALARSMASSLPASTLRIIPDAGHAAHLQAPRRIAALIGDEEVAANCGR